ncbi:ABC transporter permease [Runella sp.]|uniref:ABC transporter permease n=1 Tax=Runella sp. TaxID=1960881 RepID=UPI003D10DA61
MKSRIVKPPHWADRLLEWFVAPHLREDLQGDLYEIFQKRAEQVGLARAKREYSWAVLHYLTPYFFKRRKAEFPIHLFLTPTMIRNYFKIAFRNLIQQKGYSTITIFGLALGLAVSLLSILYVVDELSYDRFNHKSERIYRINSDITFSQKEMKGAIAPTPMGQTLKNDFPEVEQAVRLGKYGSHLVKSNGNIIRESRVLYADSTIFDVFTLPMLAGNPQKALTEPQSVVITESTAKKYFGTINALNNLLQFDNEEARHVTGIIADIPAQSHFQADFLLPLHETKDAKVSKWGNHIFNTYLLLKPGTDPKAVDAKFERVLQTYLDPALRQFFQTTLAEVRKKGNNYSYSLMPLRDIHLHSDRQGELSANTPIEYVYFFLLIALFILLIAIFNFVNLATARSAKRAREVGVRKVMGSARFDLVFQFLSESLLTSFFALLVGIGLVYLLLPSFNELADKTLVFTRLLTTSSVLYLVIGTGLVGILAGVYPAFYLSSFSPIKALKGKLWAVPKRQSLRGYLVVFQFALSVLLIIGTLLIHQQLHYIQTKKLGFNKEQVVIVKTAQSTASDVMTFKNEVLRSPSVKMGAVSGFLPVASNRGNDMWYPVGTTDEKRSVNIQEWQVDPDYIPTLEMKLVQGRNFIKGRRTDSSAVIINESAAKRLGYQNPIGKTIHKTGGEQLTIVGMVEDFHYESLRTNIEPVVMVVNGAMLGSSIEKAFLEAVSFRLTTNDIPSALGIMEKTWKQIAPGQPFDYSFLSDDFEAMYRTEQRSEQLFTSFALVAILIACLGLFGLSAFAAEQRTKEIGIRKVLGSSVTGIVRLLSNDFLKPVLVAIVVASPIGWYAMQRWLNDFAYRIDIEWWIFALAGILAVGIALLTVSFQAIKAALTDPVKSLRAE